MAIRRISDLENLQSGEQEQAQLSDCLFEVSYPHAENQYRSYSTTGAELVQNVVENLSKQEIYTFNITEELNLDGGVFNITNGGSILAWPNDGSNTCCYLHFSEMVLCSDEKFQIDGDPVVINNTLSVYKEDGFECNHPVTLDSESNVLYAQTVPAASYNTNANKKKVVTCELLYAVVGNLDNVLKQFTTGAGVEL